MVVELRLAGWPADGLGTKLSRARVSMFCTCSCTLLLNCSSCGAMMSSSVASCFFSSTTTCFNCIDWALATSSLCILDLAIMAMWLTPSPLEAAAAGGGGVGGGGGAGRWQPVPARGQNPQKVEAV